MIGIPSTSREGTCRDVQANEEKPSVRGIGTEKITKTTRSERVE